MALSEAAFYQRLRDIHPGYKFALGLCLITASLGVESVIFGLGIFLYAGLILFFEAGISPRQYLHAYKLPFIFIVVAVISVMLQTGTSVNTSETNHYIIHNFLYFNRSSLLLSIRLFSRIMGCLSGLFFISLTTTMPDFFDLLKRLHAPVFLLSMMELIWRFTFLFAERFSQTISAQDQRLGYRGLKRGIRSLGMVMGQIFSSMFQKSERMSTALEQRLYHGSLQGLTKVYAQDKKCEFSLILFSILALSAAVLYNIFMLKKF